jgi:ferredoxin
VAAPYSVALKASGRSFTCMADETILAAAQRADVEMESSCRSGLCGACKLKKVTGSVHMEEHDALTADEVEAGYVLACTAHPRGNLVLDV